MDERFLPAAVWLQIAVAGMRRRAVEAWHERHDESGMDEAVTKMIWLAVGIGVAVAAAAFFIGVFDTAKSNVPDPVAPTP
jgi:uncharacterized oligopeptide transporter (OPT) family protein